MNLAAVPILRCLHCGATYRSYGSSTCPVCYGEKPLVDVSEFTETHNRARLPGETRHHDQQIAAVDMLIAAGVARTTACREVGIDPRVYGYWRDRSQD